jgi:hypothetical protein
MIEHYAVMTPDLKALSLCNNSLEECKRYCWGNSVIVERKPVMDGFTITIRFGRFNRLISFHYAVKNVLWLHIMFHKTFRAKIIRVVYPIKERTP